MAKIVKRRCANIGRKYPAIANRIQDAHHCCFSRSWRTDECQIWRDRRILLQPGADNKSGHQRQRICVEIKARSQNKTDFLFEVLNSAVRLGALSEPYVF